MKKYILLCLLSLCSHFVIHAQMYLKGYTGYTLSTGNEKITSSETINNVTYASAYQLKPGQGLNLGLSIGYALNTNIAFEITGNTQLFSKFKHSNPYQWDFIYNQQGSYSWSAIGFFGNLEYSNTIFQVSPQVVFRSNPYKQWTFYVKGGPDFMRVKFKVTTQSIPLDFPTFGTHEPSYLTTVEYSGNVNTGIQYSFGTEYKLSDNICVFAELTTVNIKYGFKYVKNLRHEIDGVDSLSELNSTTSEGVNEKMIFNNTGLNVGIKYLFR